MQTFDDAQAAARRAKEAVEHFDTERQKRADELAAGRAAFVKFEAAHLDSIEVLCSAVAIARQELQAALQRQADAPLTAPPAPVPDEIEQPAPATYTAADYEGGHALS